MGKAPPLPAPTETESIAPTATELGTDVSKQEEEKSSYSLPDDGTPVTIKTRSHKASRSQTSLLIEYFEGGKAGSSASAGDRKPSVRVRLTPSKKSRGDHVQITETKSTRKASLSRRTPAGPSKALDRDALDDEQSLSSYASATEESNVSRNPIEVEIDRSARKRRPASPLIPASDLKVNPSEISAIPTNSFLDGSGPSARTPDEKRSRSPSRAEVFVGGAAAGLAGAALIDKMKATKNREKVSSSKSAERSDRSSERKSRSNKSRSSLGEKREDVRSPSSGKRRSSKSQLESVVSGDSMSGISSHHSPSHRSLDTHSVRSGHSINNPKLLETVEDAIRRLILPELKELKREQSKRESRDSRDGREGSRRGSLTSTGTSTLSREEITTDRRKSADKRGESSKDAARHKDRRDREQRHEYADSSPRSVDRESYASSTNDVDHTPRRSNDKLKAMAAGAAVAGLAAMGIHDKAAEEKKRRRRRAEQRSRSLNSDRYEEELDEDHAPAPPMPLMSEINASELTRTSILSAESERPHSAMEELTPIRETARGVVSAESTPTPTRTPMSLQQTIGTQHANISHGDLKALPIRRRTGDFVEEFETDEYGHKIPMTPRKEEEEEEDEYEDYDDEGQLPPEGEYAPQGTDYGYYHTQDVPAPLKYVPYQPHQRGLSPIYSVDEGGSEVQQRDSRVTHTTTDSSPEKSPYQGRHSPGSVLSNVMSREFDAEDRSLRSSGVDQRYTTYTDDSELDRVTSGQAVRSAAANPNYVHVPVGVESNVASLVDGSMLEQSVLTTGSGYDYSTRGTYSDPSKSQSAGDPLSPGKHSLVSPMEEDYEDRASTPVSRQHARSREFAEEYEIDDHGRKVPRATYNQSPTASEEVIAGAVDAAAAALKARQAQPPQAAPIMDGASGEFVPAGVSRNQSFKVRAMGGGMPKNTPSRGIDHVEYDDQPKFGASGLPDLDDPMPEIGYVDDDDELTNASVVREPLGGTEDDDRSHWPAKPTLGQAGYDSPRQEVRHEPSGGSRRGLGVGETAATAAALTAAAVMANHSQRPSRELDEEWQRTSDDRKRDTLVTNPYENASPVVNPALNDDLLTRGLGNDAFPAGFHGGSPALQQQKIDEGYISQGAIRSPDVQAKGKGVDFLDAGIVGEDPFWVPPKNHMRHMSGMSHGMDSTFFDAATGEGMDRIENRDIYHLMQHLQVRDSERDAKDTALLTAVITMAAEMRNNFDNLAKLLAETEDVVIGEIQEHTTETINKAINGPRPMPGSAPRSIQGGSQAGTVAGVDDLPAKKRNILRRALMGLGAKGTNDLGRIEDMLMQLLSEVGDLKAQSAPNGATSGQGASYGEIQTEGQYEQDRGYDAEGPSSTSHASQSGHFSVGSRGQATRQPYERRVSDNRISTVPEANEDEYDHGSLGHGGDYDDLLSPGPHEQRGSSVPLATPPQPTAPVKAVQSNENTPKTEKSKKHKSSSSSGWFPKISHWSATTTSSLAKFRGSGTSRKDRQEEEQYTRPPPSRSGSDLAAYDGARTDPYGEDKLHSGFSQDDLAPPSMSLGRYMTPEDPKYKAHRNSINLQHPQPRQGTTERFKVALESQAHEYDSPMSPRSGEWGRSATSLDRFPAQSTHRYSDSSAMAGGHDQTEYWTAEDHAHQAGPPRPPKEPLEPTTRTPAKSNRISKLQKGSPLPHQSIESGYVTGHASFTGSPKLENRNLSGALGAPTRKPSGPRAMTPKSAEEEAAREERRRKRDTFGTIASQDSETF